MVSMKTSSWLESELALTLLRPSCISIGFLALPYVMNDVFLPLGRYPENFILASFLEVCQEGGVKKEGTWRTLRVPDRRNDGHGHS